MIMFMSAYLSALSAAVESSRAAMLSKMTPDELKEWHRLNDFCGPLKPETFLERNGLMMFVILENLLLALPLVGMFVVLMLLIGLSLH